MRKLLKVAKTHAISTAIAVGFVLGFGVTSAVIATIPASSADEVYEVFTTEP